MFKRILLLTLIFFCAHANGASTQWHVLAPGLEYTKLPLSRVSNHGNLHAFKIDLDKYNFNLVFAKDHQMSASSVHRLGKLSNALVAVNVGFFSPKYEPLGLRIQHGDIRSPLKNTSWWGVFIIDNDKARILSQRRFKENFKQYSRVNFAIQAGPRLVINNHIPALKDGFAERTALGITRDGKVVIVSTQNAPISTTQLAKIMRKSTRHGGLDTPNALNLDGGSSSQLYAKLNRFYVSVPNFSIVTDAVAVLPKKD